MGSDNAYRFVDDLRENIARLRAEVADRDIEIERLKRDKQYFEETRRLTIASMSMKFDLLRAGLRDIANNGGVAWDGGICSNHAQDVLRENE